MPVKDSLTKNLKSLRMIDERTVEIVFVDNETVDVKGVLEIYKLLDEFTAGKRLKKLLIIGKHVEISKEARALIVEENHKRKDNIIAEAVVVNSFAQKLSANFYIMFLRKIYPTHFCISGEEAMEWLKQY